MVQKNDHFFPSRTVVPRLDAVGNDEPRFSLIERICRRDFQISEIGCIAPGVDRVYLSTRLTNDNVAV